MSMSAANDAADAAAPEKAVEEVSPVILTMDNDGETITLQVGQEMHISLAGNPVNHGVYVGGAGCGCSSAAPGRRTRLCRRQ